MRDRLAAFLYWAAYWLNQAADRLYYGFAPPECAITEIRRGRRWKR